MKMMTMTPITSKTGVKAINKTAKSKLYEHARAMKQDGQPINLLTRYVHSRQNPLVEQQQQQLPTTRKEDFHCQFAGYKKICKSAGGLMLHVRKMH